MDEPTPDQQPVQLTFTLAIPLGTRAAVDGATVAAALRHAVAELEAKMDPLEPGTSAAIRDPDGATVGRWEITT